MVLLFKFGVVSKMLIAERNFCCERGFDQIAMRIDYYTALLLGNPECSHGSPSKPSSWGSGKSSGMSYNADQALPQRLARA